MHEGQKDTSGEGETGSGTGESGRGRGKGREREVKEHESGQCLSLQTGGVVGSAHHL